MSSLWDSRFTDEGGEAVAQHQSRRGEENIDVSGILAATRSELPLINPQRLTFDCHLGHGSMFQVRREIYSKPDATPYFVAVKHMIVSGRSREKIRQTYAGVMRELRVLTYPPLRSHGCIVPALAYGWTDNPIDGARPFLVVDYSDHGTLTQYLNRCEIPFNERRELALDVAVGVKALHDCKIVHGDLKADNVLVFDIGDSSAERPQVAKLADFGSSLFEQDVEEKVGYYRGTMIYNAPEIEGWKTRNVTVELPAFESYQKADIYSFGLLLWEVMKSGRRFIEDSWLGPGEGESDLLQRICDSQEDELLQRATAFCESLRTHAVDKELLCAVQETLKLSLKDCPSQRADIGGIVRSLAKGTIEERPLPRYPLAIISPYGTQEPVKQHIYRLDRIWSRKHYTMSKNSREGSYTTSQNISIGAGESTSEQSVPERSLAMIVYRPSIQRTSRFQSSSLDLFQASRATAPPWEVQCDIANKWRLDARNAVDPAKRAEASLQLSVCYHIGFGVEPSDSDTLCRLHAACDSNTIAAALYNRVSLALGEGANEQSMHSTLEKYVMEQEVPVSDPKLYFSNRVRAYQRNAFWTAADVSGSSGISRLLRAAAFGSISTIKQLFGEHEFDQKELSSALTMACKFGRFNEARILVSHCVQFEGSREDPNPLHWLSMFEPPDAASLAELLVSGSTRDFGSDRGICRRFIDAIPKGSILFPEHCMELLGTPLHWAVRTRNLPLVQTFIRLGADINLRWKSKRQLQNEPDMVEPLSYSPLDIAVIFHFPEIVASLLDHGADFFGGDYGKEYSAFHVIGHSTLPFARYVIHGAHHRSAATETIQTLIDRGHDINIKDSYGHVPLYIALRNTNLERYILEALLAAGACVEGPIPPHGDDLATIITTSCADRPFNAWKLALVLPLVEDVNQVDRFGRNALHYCAIGGSAKMAEILLTLTRIDVDARAGDEPGHTALAYAAIRGNVAVMHTLVKANASIELGDRSNMTPLELAIRARQVETAALLIDLGANLHFRVEDGLPLSTVLHAAVKGASNRASIVEQLLQRHPNLRNQSLLNQFDAASWAPLHYAAYFGDVDSVKALLAAGADRNACKLDPRAPSGGTPFDIATKLLRKIAANDLSFLGLAHAAIERQGTPAVIHFTACLSEIRMLLRDNSLCRSSSETLTPVTGSVKG